MSSSVILGTARTPFGKMGGALASLEAPELGGIAIEAALERSGVGAEQVQQVIFGQVLQAGQGQIPSRQAQIKGGIPKEVPSETINKVCASGMRTLGIADQAIRAGDLEVAVTGGMESMSKAPYLLPNARFGFRMGDVAGARRDDPRRAHQPLHRQADDQRGAARSPTSSRSPAPTWTNSPSARSRWPARRPRRAGSPTRSSRSPSRAARATPRSRSTRRRVRTPRSRRWPKLKAVGGEGATHTAGNAPGVNDGAGAIVVASEEWAEKEGRKPLARVLSYAMVADDFAYLARTPGNAALKALEKIGKSPRTSTSGRSTRPSPRSRSARCGSSGSTRTTSTSTAARSPSATRSAPPAPASSARWSTSSAAAAAASASRRSAPAAARATRSCSRWPQACKPRMARRTVTHKCVVQSRLSKQAGAAASSISTRP